MLPRCYIVKQAVNAWQERLDAGRIRPLDKSRLRAAGLLEGRSPDDFKRLKQVYSDNLIPFQSPAIPTRVRKERSMDIASDLSSWAINPANPTVSATRTDKPGLALTSGGILDSHYDGKVNRINISIPRFGDLPAARKQVLTHELGHAIDFNEGTRARGYYDLVDRLLVHKIEKRAPGLVMGHQELYSPSTALDEINAEKFALPMRYPGIKEEPALQRIISHLRNNYGGVAPYANKLLGPLRTDYHAMPLDAQSRYIEPLRNKITSLLSKLRK